MGSSSLAHHFVTPRYGELHMLRIGLKGNPFLCILSKPYILGIVVPVGRTCSNMIESIKSFYFNRLRMLDKDFYCSSLSLKILNGHSQRLHFRYIVRLTKENYARNHV